MTAAINVLPVQKMFFERGITPPGRSEVSLAATTPCRLQLCVELRSIASKCLVIPTHSYTATVYGHSSDGLRETIQDFSDSVILVLAFLLKSTAGASSKEISVSLVLNVLSRAVARH